MLDSRKYTTPTGDERDCGCVHSLLVQLSLPIPACVDAQSRSLVPEAWVRSLRPSAFDRPWSNTRSQTLQTEDILPWLLSQMKYAHETVLYQELKFLTRLPRGTTPDRPPNKNTYNTRTSLHLCNSGLDHPFSPTFFHIILAQRLGDVARLCRRR